MSDTNAPEIFSALGAVLYGDASIDEWTGRGADAATEPWASFQRASELALAGKTDEAAEIWWRIAHTGGLESRHTLQAWHFLRQAGRAVPTEVAKSVLGVVVDMPVGGAHDLLAAYADGSARYVNHSGKAVVVESGTDAAIQQAIDHWIEVGSAITPHIGPSSEPGFPPLGSDEARVVMLTPSGRHFGQGPQAALSADPMAGAFISAATAVFQLTIARATR